MGVASARRRAWGSATRTLRRALDAARQSVRRTLRALFRERVDAELGLRRLVERRISQEIALRCANDRAPVFDDIESARRLCMEHLREARPGLFLEFGVFRGKSIDFFARALPERSFHGFDSFEGLPEGGGFWQPHFESGAFDLGGKLPAVRENVVLHKGWIEETLPTFLAEHPHEPVRFAHIDTDLYSSADQILRALEPRIEAGTVILFDEYCNYPGFHLEEYRAFQEYLQRTGSEYRVLCAAVRADYFGALGKLAVEITRAAC